MEVSVQLQDVKLTIYLSDPYAFITGIWIFNKGNKRVISQPCDMAGHVYERVYMLPAGAYIIRVEMNGQVKDNEVNVTADKVCIVGHGNYPGADILLTPPLYSSALIGGEVAYESSHEYYTEPAVGISKMDTFIVPGATQHSGLFIFLRYPNHETYTRTYKGKTYWEKFSLLDDKGTTIVTFPDGTIQDDNNQYFNHTPESGYIGFSATLSPGGYFLKYSGKDERQIPIHIHENWYSHLFITLKEEPLFGSMRIFLSAQRAFDPLNPYLYYVDVCLDKLQNNDFRLEPELLHQIVNGKFDSPMLALLGAYIYLNGKETKNDELFRGLVNNLRNKILINSDTCPDVWAINLLCYKHFNTMLDESFKEPYGTPTLRIAFDTIRNAAAEYPWLIQEGSLNDYVSENQVFDSPYNTFRPFAVPKEHVSSRSLNMQDFKNAKAVNSRKLAREKSQFNTVIKRAMPILNSILPVVVKMIPGKVIDKWTNKLEKLLEDPEKIGKTGYYIVNALKVKKDIDPTEIASSLNLPVNTVIRIMKELKVNK